MAYIKKGAETVVEATLTTDGVKKLVENGWLDISYFKISDAEIDYSLYDTGSISGSEYYGQYIESTPINQPVKTINNDLIYPVTWSFEGNNSWYDPE